MQEIVIYKELEKAASSTGFSLRLVNTDVHCQSLLPTVSDE